MTIPFLHLNPQKITARWIVVLVDISLVLQTFFVAYLVRFNFTLEFRGFPFVQQLPLVAVVALISFLIVGSYKGVVRHTGTRDAFNVFVAASLLAVILSILVYINRSFGIVHSFTIPLSIIAIHFLLNVLVLISSRFIFKQVYLALTKDLSKPKRVMIYGAGNSGLITYTTLKNDPNSRVNVVGYIDDDKFKKGKTYDRVRVYHSSSIDFSFVIKNKIEEIIVSIQDIAPSALMKIVDKLALLPVKVKIVPPVEKWINGTLKVSQIEDVQIEDLLDRSPIKLSNATIEKEIEGKTILITGAAGSIGSELAKQISTYNYRELVLIDQAESAIYDVQQEFAQRGIKNTICIVADVSNRQRMEEIFGRFPIQIVFHAAAYKHVPLMEQNPYEAVRVNVLGTKNLMDLSVGNSVEKFVMVSTDKAVNPTNVMGATKRTAELYATYSASKNKTKFITTRFGNVLGSNGSVIPLFKKQIEKGGPLTVTHKEITRYFMTIPEACQLVLEAGAMGEGGEIFVFDMGESVKIFDLAVKMIKLSGYQYPDEIDIEIIGLRPGEKLYEELLTNEENTRPTYHSKIMIAKVSDVDAESLLDSFRRLKNLTCYQDNEIVSELKRIVPEYQSNNSKYSQLDKS